MQTNNSARKHQQFFSLHCYDADLKTQWTQNVRSVGADAACAVIILFSMERDY
jgi:hypothetical protein